MQFNLSIELFDTKYKKFIWTNSWTEACDKLPSIKNNLVNNILKILSNIYEEKDHDILYDSNSEAY